VEQQDNQNLELNYELSDEQQQLLAEFQNARDLQAMTRSRGWVIYEQVVAESLKGIEKWYLASNLDKDKLFALHLAIQQIRKFYNDLHNRIGVQMEIASNPEAALLALEKSGKPIDPAELEGEWNYE